MIFVFSCDFAGLPTGRCLVVYCLLLCLWIGNCCFGVLFMSIVMVRLVF